MKSFLIAILLSLVMVCGGILSGRSLDRISRSLTDESMRITEAIERQDYSAALLLEETLSEHLDSNKFLLASIADHSKLEQIEIQLAELHSHTIEKQTNDAKAKCAVLIHLFQVLPNNYRLKGENIF